MLESPIQYLVSEDGQRTGVVMDWQAYQLLQRDARHSDDPELLVGLSELELQTLAQGWLSPPHQERLAELLARQQAQTLSLAETSDLDELLARIDSMNLLKARARYSLQHLHLAA